MKDRLVRVSAPITEPIRIHTIHLLKKVLRALEGPQATTVEETVAYENTPHGHLMQFLETNTSETIMDNDKSSIARLYIEWATTLPDTFIDDDIKK